MSYLTINEIADSASMQARIRACVAQEAASAGLSISVGSWVAERMLRFAASPGWADKWQYAKDTYRVDFNPDTGARSDVINDADILAVVQPLIVEMTGVTPLAAEAPAE